VPELRMFRNISCVSTGTGRLLRWDAADGFDIFKCRVYGAKTGENWVLIQDNIDGDFIYLDDTPASTFDIYKLEGVAENGDTSVVDNIPAAYIGDKAYRLIREIRFREHVLYRSQPFGAPTATLYIRKRHGVRCRDCGGQNAYNCPVEGADIFCKTCLGTGFVGGYYKYPKPVQVLMSTPHAPNQQGTEANQIMAPVQSFRTTFGGILRDHDLLRVGSEIYDVIKADTVASIANVPVVYMLSTVQILPEDIRYKTLWNVTDE